MSRPLQLEIAGGLYHVTSRGDRREEGLSAGVWRCQTGNDRGLWHGRLHVAGYCGCV